ncbi:transcriptional regulator [Mycolicibacterium flavescens]|uniref:Transcriptional regulator n=1 Tax=Mycolicibacterium flavescens TaxID=1776 RepID=A0A1E3RJ42_MYCFV|nr:transcriptional regulator [Mycolicibacterium flavescens]
MHLLGGFAVYHDGELIDLPPACRRVVTLVALKHKPVHRLWVCATLWPHAQTRQAVASLRSAVWRLRPLGAAPLLCMDPQYLQLGADVSVDWYDAGALIDDVLAGGFDAQQVAELLPLLRAGELLDKSSEPWVACERERYHGRREAAFEALGRSADKPGPHSSRAVLRGPRPHRAVTGTRGEPEERHR